MKNYPLHRLFDFRKCLTIIFLVLGNGLVAQTTIWSENFTYSNSTTSGTATGISGSSWNSGNGVSVNSNRIESVSSNNNGYWRTASINIRGFKDIELSFSVGNSGVEGTDRFSFRYRLDGGNWVNLVAPILNPNNSYSFSLEDATTLELEASFSTNKNNDSYRLDNILLQGTLPGCPNVLDYEFYDGVPSGNTVNNIPTTGALSTGQIGDFNVAALQNTVDPGDTDSFGIRYTGYIQIETAGSYTFYTFSDDGSKLYINGDQVVDNDGDHGSQERSGTVSLTKGLHHFRVLYFENAGGQVLEVRYQGPSISKRVLPFTILSSDCTAPIVIPDPDNQPPSIEATGNQLYCPGVAIPIVESVSITDPDDTTIDKVFVQISSNYDNGKDQLLLTGTHPNITSSWSALEGKLTLTGPATLAAFETALMAVRFNTSATVTSGNSRNFSIVLSEANYLISTKHYYEYVPAVGITWIAARNAAAARKFYGLQGYLATITIADEAALLGKQSSGAGWIGASDAAVEGEWRWVTGPEANTQFWQGVANGYVTPPNNYANWNTGEPNQSGDEDYAHINAPGTGFDGSWNDLPLAGGNDNYQPKGYLVEYGGMPGDPPHPNISAVTSIFVDNIKPTASNPAPVTVYCTSGIPVPDINVVTDEADNCTTNPIVTFVNDISNGGSNPEIITRTYRVTDAAGNSTDVTQTITLTPLLITVPPSDQTIFAGASASFTVSTANINTYQWQVSTNGGVSFVDLSDGAGYGGTATNTLSVNNSHIGMNGFLYRVNLSNSNSTCPAITSDHAVLNVRVGTVITNKRITYRVKGN